MTAATEARGHEYTELIRRAEELVKDHMAQYVCMHMSDVISQL